jgi:hypothetical protein
VKGGVRVGSGLKKMASTTQASTARVVAPVRAARQAKATQRAVGSASASKLAIKVRRRSHQADRVGGFGLTAACSPPSRRSRGSDGVGEGRGSSWVGGWQLAPCQIDEGDRIRHVPWRPLQSERRCVNSCGRWGWLRPVHTHHSSSKRTPHAPVGLSRAVECCRYIHRACASCVRPLTSFTQPLTP